MTLVSVVVPYRGRADWLEAAVASVLAQSLQDFELIVVDDGSDERPAFLERDRDPRVRYVPQEHRGASAARNHGIALSTGRYIAFLDADDLLLPEKLQVQVQEMESHPEAGMSHTSYSRIDEAGDHIEDVASGTLSGRLYPAIVTKCPIATPTVMVRREALEQTKLGFSELHTVGEDVILWIQIARRFTVLGIDQVLTAVRMHGSNAYADPRAQYRGGIAILADAFRADPDFGFVFRRRAFARVCLFGARLFLERRDQANARRCAARAVIYWPFDWGSVRLLLILALPGPIRTALRHLRDSSRQLVARRVSK